jgi:hypothetical protein
MSLATLIIGASPKPHRFAFKALSALQSHQQPIVLFSPKGGQISRLEVHTNFKHIAVSIETVTLYVNPQRLAPLLADIIALKPRRVIFNPGTESPDAAQQLQYAGIEAIQDCTLIMLREAYY